MYFLEDLFDNLQYELRYNRTAQVAAVVIGLAIAIGCFVTFIAIADPTPSSVQFWFPE